MRKTDDTEEVYVNHDNMLKVEAVKNAHNTIVASAGDAKFAKHILNKLAKADFLDDGIAGIRANIKDWLLPIAGEYFQNGYTTAAMIFGGADSSEQISA